MTTIIHIDGAQPLQVLDAHGWTQGTYGDGTGEMSLHGAIRLCQPVPGDAMIIERVAALQGWGVAWNDAKGTTEQMVRNRLARGIDITDTDLADTFGPQWSAVVALVRRCAVLTVGEAERLRRLRTDAARDAARDAALDTAWDAALGAALAARAALGAAWDAARAARGAAWRAARGAARGAAWHAAWGAAAGAGSAVVTYHLATQNGPYTYAQRDLLLAPWVTVIGPIEGLVAV